MGTLFFSGALKRVKPGDVQFKLERLFLSSSNGQRGGNSSNVRYKAAVDSAYFSKNCSSVRLAADRDF